MIHPLLQASGSSLAGTYIEASERVAVFSSGKNAVIPGGPTGHFLEQAIPIGRHGKQYVVPAVPGQSEVMWRAVTTHPTTLLTSSQTNVLDNRYHDAGDVITSKAGAKPAFISGDQPFSMVQVGSGAVAAGKCYSLITIDLRIAQLVIL